MLGDRASPQEDRQQTRLDALFADDAHVEVETTWAVYQQMITAYREPDPHASRQLMEKLIGSLSAAGPAALSEVTRLGRTLKQRAIDVLAYFDRPGASNGPTETINGRSNTSAAPPSASGTSPTKSPDACSKPADSDHAYTLDCEEPLSP